VILADREINVRDAKLIQYLNEAYGKERQLETALEAHIGMATRDAYKKRLKQHLSETKSHAREVERRIKQLGGEAETVSVPGPDVVGEAASVVQDVAQRGVALAQGSLQAVRGTGTEEKQLKNAKDEYSDEAQEIATYTAIETLASSVGDRTTAKLARTIRRQEERMASFLERLIPQLTKAVVQAEIPVAFRNGSSRSSKRTTGSSARRSTASTRRTTGSARRSTSARRTTGSKRQSTGSTRRTTGSSRRTTGSSRRTTGSSARSAAPRRATARRKKSSRSR
jgi:ferritin-like metal-binding protein YciE